MKKNYQLLAALLLPLPAIAQPVITTAENYSTGTVVRRIICDPAASGGGGISQTWNFTGLAPTGDTLVQYNTPPVPGNPFPLASLAQFNPNESSYTHLEQTANETLLWGLLDSSGNNSSLYYSDPMLLMSRPFTFIDTATDTFAFTSNYSGFPVYGSGNLAMEADGYGTLYLPNDTFTNVLRVRTEVQEMDSIDGIGNLYFNNVFYVWYSNLHHSPVLRVDSINMSGVASLEIVDVQYLYTEAPTTGVRQVEESDETFAAALTNSTLVVTANFRQEENYEVWLFSMDGKKVFGTDFVAGGDSRRFDVPAGLAAGNYIVALRRKGDINSFRAIKVLKE